MDLHKKGRRGHANIDAEREDRPIADRRAEGKALRDTVAREDHDGWKPSKDRRAPVEILVASNEGQRPELVPIRHGRMLQSPFAFYRGSAALMAADLARTPDRAPHPKGLEGLRTYARPPHIAPPIPAWPLDSDAALRAAFGAA